MPQTSLSDEQKAAAVNELYELVWRNRNDRHMLFALIRHAAASWNTDQHFAKFKEHARLV